MPVDQIFKLPPGEIIYLRKQYEESALTRWFTDHRDRRVFSFILPEYKRIVDIGCGEGITLEKMVKVYAGKEVSGIDAEEENISICRSLGLPVQQGSVYDLHFDEGSVDCCTMTDVIEHLDEPERVLRELSRVLRGKGRLIIVFPHDRLFTLARLLTFKFKQAFYFPGHVRQWTPGSMARALEAAGFRIQARENIPFGLWAFSLYHLVVAEKK